MKKVILIPDSFKGTMSSAVICRIMKKTIQKHYPDCEIISIPVADGGEGTVDAFLEALGGEKHIVTVTGPYEDMKVEGYWGMLPDYTAVIEMAAAAALPMVGKRKDPSSTTTYGVGEIIIDAARHGARKIIIGLGGSATNDAATGLASACGITFKDCNGRKFQPMGKTLKDIAEVDLATMNPILKHIPMTVMCDIDNPFYGPDGAAEVYGPQKGADRAMVDMLDEGMKSFAEVLEETTGINVQELSGSGAAGGMGGGLNAMFSTPLKRGIETILDTVGFDELLADCDFVYTGEGRIDGQSLRGKAVLGIAERAKRKDVKVLAFVGDIGDDIETAYNKGVTGIFSINRVAVPYEEAKRRAERDLELTLDNILRYNESMSC